MKSDLEWFLEAFRWEMPERIHCRATDAGGDPSYVMEFENYVTDGEYGRWATYATGDSHLARCSHDGQPKCGLCGGSGYTPKLSRKYQRPMKVALGLLHQRWQSKDRPRLDVLLRTLAYNDGNVAATAMALRPAYSYMWSVERAERFVDYALRELRRVYREEEDSRRMEVVIGRSDSQLNAEAA